MIAFKDFVPQQIREQEVAVINVETVIAPDLTRKGMQSGDGQLFSTGSSIGGWSQVVRVWYRAD